MSIRGFRVPTAFHRCAMGVLVLLAVVALGRCAAATTIYTYNFIQTDYVYSLGAGSSFVTTVRGGFTGTADASGHINIGTLSDFRVEYDISPFGSGPGVFYGYYSGVPDYFSFLIGDTSGSTLAFQAPLTLNAFSPYPSQICVGAAVAFLCNGGTPRGIVTVSFDETGSIFARSDIAPVVSLVSSSTVAATPIPGALLLFATALGGAGAVGALRRRIGAKTASSPC
jgi:hypothetical protein